MQLVARRPQTVPIGMTVRFAAGETIHTESSFKYAPREIEALALATGLGIEADWLDPVRCFSLTLFAPTGG